ncbi:BT0820 family HAD-type phosphatase [Dysgonomonas termitidis]|uniref:BT0820 family HAD-type phosphatase n=1 Tax=Dysgonomonas termitidis TaxID=1516126 RepID=A0ABV9KRL5_9BACT
MVIAVDFDGTIVEHEYPKIGKAIPFAIETLLQLQKEGHILLMWTVRDGDMLQEAVSYCEKKGLKFYAANKNHPDEDVTTSSRKLNADMFIDDRNLGGLPDWGVIYHAIKAMERGETSFERIMMSSGENQRIRRRKKNFFIRLGEMFENNRY